jgi:GDP-L-fucose synthase
VKIYNDTVELRNKRALVTGGGGFLGSYVVERLRKKGCSHISAPRSIDYDLREKNDIQKLFDQERPEIVIHLAAVVGGIGANQAHPGRFFYDSAIMGVQLIEISRQYDIEKMVCIGTVCSYPKFTPAPFREEDLWSGYPEETNAPYGLAKKMLLVQLQAYRQEYHYPGIFLIPVNLYGPRDNFDPETSHVIPALIRKFVEAKRQGFDEVTVWGTGRATREFLYVEDAAEGIVKATEEYDKFEPVNLGSGSEISILELVTMIQKAVGYEGQIQWDHSKPDGQPRRLLDTSRALNEFGWQATTSFEDGLKRTIDWYLSQ